MQTVQNEIWFDNIGHEIMIGDEVLCLTGSNSYKFEKISKLFTKEEIGFQRKMVSLENRTNLSSYNIITLKSLGMTRDSIAREKTALYGHDLFGHSVNVGDKVLFLHRLEMYVEIGIAIKLTPKTCVLEIAPNRFGQRSYKKAFGEIISLTALGLDENIINRANRE